VSRSLGHWAAFVLSLAAVLALAVAFQAFGELVNHRFDLTEEKRLSLSPYSLSVLNDVKDPLHVELYYRRGDRSRPLELLELLRDHCRNVSYDLVDLDRNPGKAKDHGVDHYDRAVLSYRGRETVVPAGTEETLVGGIAKLLHDKPRIAYFAVGHRERGIAPGKDEDYGRAATLLKNEGWELRTLSLLHEPTVPQDASIVIVAGPEVDLVESEIDKLDAYVRGGGSALLLVDPVQLPKLEAWLAKQGIVLRDDVIIDRENRVYGSDGTNAVVPFYREHDATRALDIPSVLGRARSVSLASGTDDDPENHASVVARTSKESFAATDASRTKAGDVTFDKDRDRQGPIGIMAAATVGAGKLVVIGDADFPSDSYLPLLGNKDLWVGTLGWLTADTASGARPREQASRLGPVSPVFVSDQQARWIFILTVLAQPLSVMALGTAVVLVRQRRR